MESKIKSITEDVDKKEKYTADLDQALAVAGKRDNCIILFFILINCKTSYLYYLLVGLDNKTSVN